MRRKQKHKYKAARCLKLMLIQKAVQDTLTASFTAFFRIAQFAFLLPDSDAYLLRRLFFFMAAICLLYLFIEKLIPTARAPITAINQ